MLTASPPLDALKRHWGFESFRPLQREAVEAALAGRDSLVMLPTGGGKSLCYQLPAACTKRLVLVVSPLIALMDDQVAAARQVGLRAAALHSHVPEKDRPRIRQEALNGVLQLLYLSPERLVIGDLIGRAAPHLALIAIDEAHCVSHWGHDFRPEYRQLKGVLEQAPDAPRMALTATATPQVQQDIEAQLGLRQPLRLVGHIDRPNLTYRALARHDGAAQVLSVIRRHPSDGGIVYAQTRKDVDRLNDNLRARGVRCAPYHAGMPPEERVRVQSDFVNERLDVVVATIAFGMGIDRSNVRYVVHANTPKSIEHYQQEAGRAGRDGLPAECVLLYSAADTVTHRFLATRDGQLPPERQRTLERQLREMGSFAVAPVCRHRILTEHFGQPYPNPEAGQLDDGSCGACDVCLGETEELAPEEALTTAHKIISTVWRTGGRYGAAHVASVLLGRKTEMVERAKHNFLSVWGLLSGTDERAIRSWIDQLVVQGYLELTEDRQYTFVQMTAAGRQLCQERSNEARLVRLGRYVKSTKSARRPAMLLHHDEALFERLRQLRRTIADHQDVPPYVVFSDATLSEMAASRPATPAELLHVKGVGETKLSLYGSAFLAVIGGQDPEVAVKLAGG